MTDPIHPSKRPIAHCAGLAIPLLMLACGLAGAGQQRRHPVARKPAKAASPKRAPAQANPPAATLTQAIRENNLGLALMDRRDFSGALGKFQTACVMNPDSDAGCLNMGIALLNMGRYDDAQKVLAKSIERDPQSARAWYNLGLLERASGHPEAARDDFQKVAALDPDDADTQYYLGYLASQAQQYDQAVTAFTRAIELDPFHASAEFGLSQAEQHTGDADGAKAHLERFQRIAAEKLGKPVRFLYRDQGRYSLGQEMAAPAIPVPPAIPVHFVQLTPISGLPRLRLAPAARARPGGKLHGIVDGPPPPTLESFLGGGACILDYDGDGRPDIFLVNANGEGNAALYRNAGKGTFVNATKAAKLEIHGAGMGCAVGDYDNDGHPDLAVTSGDGLALFHNEGNGTFKDVTDAAGLRRANPNGDQSTGQSDAASAALAMGVTFVDYDQDGDLDIYVTRFINFLLDAKTQPFTFPEGVSAPGNILWRSKGDGTFVDRTKELALGGSAPSVGAIGNDLNNDGAVDLVVTGWQKFPTVFMNTREGAFHATSPWAISMPGPAAGVVAADFDHDGWMDLAFTHWASPAVTIWRNVQGKSFERVPLVGPGWMRGWGIAALDYDNDGWVDIVAVGETFAGEGRIALLRNEGPAGFRDVTRETGLDKIVLHDSRGVIAFDFDGDGSADLLITQNNLPPVLLKNVGGNKNGWLKLVLSGDPDNKIAIGTKVDIFSGAQRQSWEVTGSSGYLGQGSAEILSGLGSEHQADVIRLFWPTGLLQNEMQVPGGARATIPESEPGNSPH
ncbi:MAG: FG-GAP-like repeat-containing protein [Candidatus Acidiferrales bacterium]